MSQEKTYLEILEHIDAAGQALRLAARVMENLRMTPPTLSQLTASMAHHLQCDRVVAAALLEQVGIQEPLEVHLTEARIGRFLGICRRHPVVMPIPPGQRFEREVEIVDLPVVRKPKKPLVRPAGSAPAAPQPMPARETAKQQAERLEREREDRLRAQRQRIAPRAVKPAARLAPPADPVAAKAAARLAQARRLLETASRQHVSPATRVRRQEVLVRDLANALTLPPSAVQPLMSSAGLTLSSGGLSEPRIAAFLAAVRAHPAYAQQATAKTRPNTATVPTVTPAVRGKAALPACRRLVAGNTSGDPARLTADLYLTIVELAAYGAAPEQRAAATIAAERFGIHADATTAAQLHARAQRTFHRGMGGATLDHLSRLARRPRGVFFDDRLNRLTLWETDGPTMTIYTCSVPELRSCAAAALELGDLTLPRLTTREIDARTEPDRPEDPALILAVAAEQLGKQSELARRHAEAHADTEPDRPDQVLTLTSGHRPKDRSQVARPGVMWVVPVAGAHEDLDVGRMDVSYTHHVEGPRSRAATTVREHLRRPAGSSPYAQPTIRVRAHPRRGT